MRVFCASLATETNTFSPLRTDFDDFAESMYAPPGQHPATPTLCSAVFCALRDRQEAGEIELVEGTAAWAEPGGLLNGETWHRLRDEVLDQLRAALPVDAVVLGLHGAMIADNCLDCEGEIIEMARQIVGPDVKIGVTFDPHSHLTAKRTDNADVIVSFKEFPHVDFVETGEACVGLILRAVKGEIKPVISVFDVLMVDVMPTTRNPMRAYMDRIIEMERRGEVLSVSVIHGFLAGNSPDLGAKIIVITDNDKEKGDRLAHELGMELYSFRGQTRPEFLPPDKALQLAAAHDSHPVVIADVWDNPGGGTAGDSTILLREAIRQGIDNVAFGTIWDPMAVRLCFAAGEGAELLLRIGGKTSRESGDPVDLNVRVMRIQADAHQSFGASIVPMGNCAVVRTRRGMDIVLNSIRSQCFSPDLFSNLGIDPLAKEILVVKSTSHFHGAFAPVTAKVLYAAVEGPYPDDPLRTSYTNLTRPVWPIHDDPHGEA